MLTVSAADKAIFDALSPNMRTIFKEGAQTSDGTVVLPAPIGFDSLTDDQIDTVLGSYRAGLLTGILGQTPTWTALTLENGAVAEANQFTPAYGQVGSKVWIRGGVSVSANTVFATLPESARPSRLVVLPVASGRLFVTTNGQIYCDQDNPSLDGVEYWTQ